MQHVLELNYPAIWEEINTTGGLAIDTTLNMTDQLAADHAVNYVQPPNNSGLNPGHNADTEVLIQPGTGQVRAIAVNRVFGNGNEARISTMPSTINTAAAPACRQARHRRSSP